MSCRIGLVASAGHRSDPDSALFRFMASFQRFFAEVLDAELFVTGATHDALEAASLLEGITAHRLRPNKEGGLITLAALLVGLDLSDPGLDWIIYLQDPYDPTTLYPEAQALKRQTTVHGKPFLANEAAASEWCTLEWLRLASDSPELPSLIDRWVRPQHLGDETLGLIAHDAFKSQLVAFAASHRPLLSRFGRRLATGTTGGLLNGVVPDRLSANAGTYSPLAVQSSGRWVDALLSGPKGGDAQIAQEVVEGRCRRVIFLEDPHVAREHESDIQLLERATRFSANGCLCLNSRVTAERWAENIALLLGASTD
jgi:methylglyoxal synthase